MAQSLEQLELQSHGHFDNGDDGVGADTNPNSFALPPADRGKAAWLFLAGGFAVEALAWGFPFSFGVFEEFLISRNTFSTSSGISAIGTTALGLMYLGSPVIFIVLQFYPQARRLSAAAGLLVMVVALIASSFASAVSHLILTQGVLYGIGGSMLYCPVILFLDEWFVRRKGMAYGIMWAGTGFSGVTVPYLLSTFLHRYGFRTTLRIWSITITVLTAPFLYWIKPRIPLSETRAHRKLNVEFARSPDFYIHELCIFLQGLGYFTPGLYLPLYGKSIGLNDSVSTVPLALMNGAAVFGCLFIGALIDRFHVTTGIGICSMGAMLSVFILWGFATSVPLLMIFSILYGFFAGSFSANWSGVLNDIRKKNQNAQPGLVFGAIAVARGIGSVICGPLNEALISTSGDGGKATWASAKFGYGTKYGPLIVWTGISAALGGTSLACRRLKWL